MRTTIEIRPEYHAMLVEAAARRGQKGFSSIIDEALTQYLEKLSEEGRAVKEALAQEGVLTHEEADHMRKVAAELRSSWR